MHHEDCDASAKRRRKSLSAIVVFVLHCEIEG
jgi:hypothetical protein